MAARALLVGFGASAPLRPYSRVSARAFTMDFRFIHRSTTRAVVIGTVVTLTCCVPSARACSECGCTLSSDWSAQGYPDVPGFTASSRFDYYDSNDLRSGSHEAGTMKFPAAEEVQRETLNRDIWLGLDYVGTKGWAIDAQLPFLDRYHSTVAEGDTAVSESRATGIGDMRLLARYQKFSMYHSYGIQFGLKLPTGRFDQVFATGPQAGEPLDRGLQLGSGTTDMLAGASYFRRPTPNLGLFAQILGDLPLYYRAGFQPAANVAVNAGIRYLNSSTITPQLQVNVRWDAREHGANADTANSGGVTAYVSPGVTVELGPRASGFVFVQLPLYRRFNGLQLAPHAFVSMGTTYRF